MKIKQCSRLLALAALLCSASAFAQPGLQCGTAIVGPGNSGSVVCDYLGTGSTATGGQFDLGIGNASITIDSFTCATGFTCPAVAADPSTIVFLDLSFSEVQDTTAAVTVNFTVDSMAATGGPAIPVVVSNEQYSADGINPITPVGTTNGAITVQAGPGPGILNVQPATLDLTADVNAPAGTGTITISNDGLAGDDTIVPSCSLGTPVATAGALGTVTVTTAPASLAPGASGTVTASCSGSMEGTTTVDYSCTATSGGTPAVTNGTTAISCVVAAGTPSPNPAAGSTVTATVGPVVRGSAGVASVLFSETNNSGGAYTVTCTLDDNGGGAFALAGAATATVTGATPFNFQVTGQSSGTDPQPSGAATCTYSAGATGTVAINLGIALIPEIVPTMSEWGLIILTLALVGFGAFQLRRRTPLA
ncbi:MAG: IPTL-CTERM sorting domain-containing protein [Lysobacterales bacterium]